MQSTNRSFAACPPSLLALVVILLAALNPAAPAQTLQLADIGSGAVGGNISDATAYGGFIWFAAETAGAGKELWRTDGTPGGTALFLDINPGAASSNPAGLRVANGRLYFRANDGVAGVEPWSTDGTLAGTTMLANINVGAQSSNAQGFTAYGSEVFFSAESIGSGNELWRSDGTSAGTMIAADINPTIHPLFGALGSNPSNLKVAGGLLFFSADDGLSGAELWAHDGSTAIQVMDIFPGVGLPFGTPNSSFPSQLVDFFGFLFFVATDGVNGTELWMSDGTAFGTAPVADINPGASSSLPADLTLFGGQLYFSANDGSNGRELWQSPGPFQGASLVRDIQIGSGSSSPSSLFVHLSGLFFAADNGVVGRELWVSDGTALGTMLAADLSTGAAGSDPMGFAALSSGDFVFSATTPATGREPWVSDGSAAGSERILDINPCATGSAASSFVSLGARVVFLADNGSSGLEAWVTDGVPIVASGIGQAPQSGLAVLDVNLALEVGGAPVCTGRNGPYFAQANVGGTTTMSFEGVPNQAILLLSGPLNAGVATFPGIGQLDIGSFFSPAPLAIGGVVLLANGMAPGLLNQVFNLGAAGQAQFSFSNPPVLAGSSTALQAFVFNAGPTVISLSNAVQVSFL